MNAQTTADRFSPPSLQHARWFWVTGGAVVFVQLVAFWLLCSWQVQLSQDREAVVQAQRAAAVLVDCSGVPVRSRSAACASHVATAR